MTDCIDCGKTINKLKGTTLCGECAGIRVDELTPEKLAAMAKIGLDALIDEVTGYEKIRPQGDLKKRYDGYLGEHNE